MAQTVVSGFSIYTIAHPEKLAKAAAEPNVARFEEKKAWRTGYRLWKEANSAGLVMPVLFGDSTACSRLVYWGILTKLVVDGKTTKYFVKHIRELKGRHAPKDLVLRSSGKHISPNFIRPYALCRTPSFLLRACNWPVPTRA